MLGSHWTSIDHRLTGKTRTRLAYERIGLFRTQPVLVQQVEEEYRSVPLPGPWSANAGHVNRRWRDLTIADLKAPDQT